MLVMLLLIPSIHCCQGLTFLFVPRNFIPVTLLEFCHFPTSLNSKLFQSTFFYYLNNVVLEVHKFPNFQVPNILFSPFPCCPQEKMSLSVANNLFALYLPNAHVSARYNITFI